MVEPVMTDAGSTRTAEEVVVNLAAAMGHANVTVLSHDRNPHAATFDAEIVRCRWADGSEDSVLCKVGSRHPNNPDDDHGSVAYEALVYDRVLVPHGMSPLRFFGTHVDNQSGATWLILDYLRDAVTVDRAPDRLEAMSRAAAWIGRFHGSAAHVIEHIDCGFLVRYTPEHYLPWAERTLALAQRAALAPSWLDPVVRYYRGCVDVLGARPVTVIHGDYYADNTLIRDGAAYPIDWGWAAVAPGELDLAALIDGWPDDVSSLSVRSYAANRGRDGEDPDFRDALVAARFYQLFRWLGRRADLVGSSRWNRRLKRLRQCAVSVGVIG